MFVVILMAGKKRSGKNTAAQAGAEYLQELGWHTYQMAFADELRTQLGILNPLVGVSPYTNRQTRWQEAIKQRGYEEAKEKYPEMRRLQQVYGTEVARANDPMVWIDHVRRKLVRIKDAKQPSQKVAVFLTDCRFYNETYVVGKYFADSTHLVHTIREGDPNQDGHASEDLSWIDREDLADNNIHYHQITASTPEDVVTCMRGIVGKIVGSL